MILLQQNRSLFVLDQKLEGMILVHAHQLTVNDGANLNVSVRNSTQNRSGRSGGYRAIKAIGPVAIGTPFGCATLCESLGRGPDDALCELERNFAARPLELLPFA